MKCPVCKQETSSLLNYCEKCKADLTRFNAEREEVLKKQGAKEAANHPIIRFHRIVVIIGTCGTIFFGTLAVILVLLNR